MTLVEIKHCLVGLPIRKLHLRLRATHTWRIPAERDADFLTAHIRSTVLSRIGKMYDDDPLYKPVRIDGGATSARSSDAHNNEPRFAETRTGTRITPANSWIPIADC